MIGDIRVLAGENRPMLVGSLSLAYYRGAAAAKLSPAWARSGVRGEIKNENASRHTGTRHKCAFGVGRLEAFRCHVAGTASAGYPDSGRHRVPGPLPGRVRAGA